MGRTGLGGVWRWPRRVGPLMKEASARGARLRAAGHVRRCLSRVIDGERLVSVLKVHMSTNRSG